MPTIDIKKILEEYVATANNPEYKSDFTIINSKFPELKGYDPKLLEEYVATANNEEYKSDFNIINSKFPELFEPEKKKGFQTDLGKAYENTFGGYFPKYQGTPLVGSTPMTKMARKQPSLPSNVGSGNPELTKLEKELNKKKEPLTNFEKQIKELDNKLAPYTELAKNNKGTLPKDKYQEYSYLIQRRNELANQYKAVYDEYKPLADKYNSIYQKDKKIIDTYNQELESYKKETEAIQKEKFQKEKQKLSKESPIVKIKSYEGALNIVNQRFNQNLELFNQAKQADDKQAMAQLQPLLQIDSKKAEGLKKGIEAQKLEAQFTEADDIANNFNIGVYRAMGTMMQGPKAFDESVAVILADVAGIPQESVKAYMENVYPATSSASDKLASAGKFVNKIAEERGQEKNLNRSYGGSAYEALLKGDVKTSANYAFKDFVQSFPSSMTYVNPATATLSSLGMVGEELQAAKDRGEQIDSKTVLAGGIKAGLEIATERWLGGTKSAAKLLNSLGKEGAEQAIRQGVEQLAKKSLGRKWLEATGEEVVGESINQLGSNAVDIYLNGNKEKSLFEGVGDAALISVFGGGVQTGLSETANHYLDKAKYNKAQAMREEAASLTDKAMDQPNEVAAQALEDKAAEIQAQADEIEQKESELAINASTETVDAIMEKEVQIDELSAAIEVATPETAPILEEKLNALEEERVALVEQATLEANEAIKALESVKEPIQDFEFTEKGGNKVVDEKKQPLVLYHGTFENIDKFNDRPTYLTLDKDYAKKIATITNESGKASSYKEERNVKAIPVNIKAERIFEVPDGVRINSKYIDKLLQDPEFLKKYDAVKGIDLYSDAVTYVVFKGENIKKIQEDETITTKEEDVQPMLEGVQTNRDEGKAGETSPKLRTEQAKEEVVEEEPAKEEVVKDIQLSGLRDGFKGVTYNSFDIRSDQFVMENIKNGESFITTISRNGKEFIAVGLKIKQNVGAKTSGRDGYSFATIEKRDNLPANINEILTEKAKENAKNLYPDIPNIEFKEQSETTENKGKDTNKEQKVESKEESIVEETPALKDVESTAKALEDISISKNKTERFYPDDKVILTTKDGNEVEVSFRGYNGENKAVIFGSRGSGINQMEVDVSQLRSKNKSDKLTKDERKNLLSKIDFQDKEAPSYNENFTDKELQDLSVRFPNMGKLSNKEKNDLNDFQIATTPLKRWQEQEYGVDDPLDPVNIKLAKEHETAINNIINNDKFSILLSESYHKAKQDGSNPELVKAVEELLTNKKETPATKAKSPFDLVAEEENAYRQKQEEAKKEAKKDIELINSDDEATIEKYFKKSRYKEMPDGKGYYFSTGASRIIKKTKKQVALDTANNIISKKPLGLPQSRVEEIVREFETNKQQEDAIKKRNKSKDNQQQYQRTAEQQQGKQEDRTNKEEPITTSQEEAGNRGGSKQSMESKTQERVARTEKSIDEAAEWLKSKLKIELPEGTKKSGGGFTDEQLIDLVAKAAKAVAKGAIVTAANIKEVLDTLREGGFLEGVDEDVISKSVLEQETPTIEEVSKSSGISPKNLRDLYNINRDLFGLDRLKSLSSAIAMDKMIGVMAKRAGIPKSEMYGKLKFEKATEQDLPQGVKLQVDAWHGSPYQFDKFTTEKIGTGEGAQAFGWGLYFTDLKSIANQYAKMRKDDISFLKSFESNGVRIYDLWIEFNSDKDGLIRNVINGNQERAISYLKRFKNDLQKELESKIIAESLKNGLKEQIDLTQKAIDGLNDGNYTKTGSLYKVSLHKGKTPDQYTWLEWDESIPNNIDNKIYNSLSESQKKKFDSVVVNDEGQSIYEALSKTLGGYKQASLFLLENGIDGIKYPAESISRGATSDTARGFNYVVFDENAVSIEEVIKFQKDANKARGAVMVSMDGQAVIYALTDPNVSTPLHELAHVFEHYLTEEEKKDIQSWANTKGWTIETSEKFARGFEKYLATGNAPTSALQKIFDNFKKWLTEIYDGIVGSDIDLELNDKMEEIYSKMLGGKIQPKKEKVEEPKSKTSKFFDTISNNKSLEEANKVLSDDIFEYIPKSQDESRKKAKAYIDKVGVEDALENFLSNSVEGLELDEEVALASLLTIIINMGIERNIQEGNLEGRDVLEKKYQQLIEAARNRFTKLGQAVNAIKLFLESMSSPELAAYRLENSVRKANEEIKKKPSVKTNASTRVNSGKKTINEGVKKAAEEVAKELNNELYGVITKGKKGLTESQKKNVKDFFNKLKIDTKNAAFSTIIPIPPKLYNDFVEAVGNLVVEGVSVSVAMTQISTEFIKNKIASPDELAQARKILSEEVNGLKEKKPLTEAQKQRNAAREELRKATAKYKEMEKLAKELEKERERVEKLRKEEAKKQSERIDKATNELLAAERKEAEKNAKELEKKIKELTKEISQGKALQDQVEDIINEYLKMGAMDNTANQALIDLVKERLGITDEKQAVDVATKIAKSVVTNIREKLSKKWDADIKRQREKETKEEKVKDPHKEVNDFVKGVALGSMDAEQFIELFGAKYGLETLTEQDFAKVKELAAKVRDAETKHRKAKALNDMVQYINSKAPVTLSQLFDELWYFKVLSPALTFFLGTADTNLTYNATQVYNTIFELPIQQFITALKNKAEIAKDKKGLKKAEFILADAIRNIAMGYAKAVIQRGNIKNVDINANTFLNVIKTEGFLKDSISYFKEVMTEGSGAFQEFESPFKAGAKTEFEIRRWFKLAKNGDMQAKRDIVNAMLNSGADVLNLLVKSVPRSLAAGDLFFSAIIKNAYLPALVREYLIKNTDLRGAALNNEVSRILLNTDIELENAKQRAVENRMKFDIEIKPKMVGSFPFTKIKFEIYDKGKLVKGQIFDTKEKANEYARRVVAPKSPMYEMDVTDYLNVKVPAQAMLGANRLAGQAILGGSPPGMSGQLLKGFNYLNDIIEKGTTGMEETADELKLEGEDSNMKYLNNPAYYALKTLAVVTKGLSRLMAFRRVGIMLARNYSNYVPPIGLLRYGMSYLNRSALGINLSQDQIPSDVERDRMLAQVALGTFVTAVSVTSILALKGLMDDDDDKDERIAKAIKNIQEGTLVGSLSDILTKDQIAAYKASGDIQEFSIYLGLDKNGKRKWRSVKPDPSYSSALILATYAWNDIINKDDSALKSAGLGLASFYNQIKEMGIGQGLPKLSNARSIGEFVDIVAQTAFFDNLEITKIGLVTKLTQYLDRKKRLDPHWMDYVEDSDSYLQGTANYVLNEGIPFYNLGDAVRQPLSYGALGEEMYRTPSSEQGFISASISYLDSGKNKETRNMYRWLASNGYDKIFYPNVSDLKDAEGHEIKLSMYEKNKLGMLAAKASYLELKKKKADLEVIRQTGGTKAFRTEVEKIFRSNFNDVVQLVKKKMAPDAVQYEREKNNIEFNNKVEKLKADNEGLFELIDGIKSEISNAEVKLVPFEEMDTFGTALKEAKSSDKWNMITSNLNMLKGKYDKVALEQYLIYLEDLGYLQPELGKDAYNYMMGEKPE